VNEPTFRKSSRCASGGCVEVAYIRASACNGGACVEVGHNGDQILVRDSKHTDSPVLTFDRPAWTAFLDAVRAGDLDGAA
jgi:hypothetical protein